MFIHSFFCAVDLDTKEMQFFVNGKSTGIAFAGFEAADGLYPAVLIGRNTQVELNFGANAWAYPPPPVNAAKKNRGDGEESSSSASSSSDSQWLPLEHPLITNSSWLARSRYSSAVTMLMFRRQRLPESVIRAALKHECSLVAQPIRFTVVKTMAPESAASPPDNMLTNDDTQFFTATQVVNFCMTFAAQGDVDVLLREVHLRCQQNQSLQGMIFCSSKVPDFDSFSHTDGWTQAQYDSFVAEAKRLRRPIRAHEPVAFFQATNNSPSVRVKMQSISRCRYITIKVSALMHHQPLLIQNVKFTVVHGSHPLASLIGTPLLDIKRNEMKQTLLNAAMAMGGAANDNEDGKSTSPAPSSLLSSSSSSLSHTPSPDANDAVVWTRTMDDALVTMVRMLTPANNIHSTAQ